MNLKEKYIQFCCDFYNEHTPEDKIWFGRMFDDCHQEHNKRNSSMYRWQFPLKVLKDQEDKIDQHQLEIHSLGEANLNQAMMLAKKQEEIDGFKSQLRKLGYTDTNSQLMRPPIGRAPNFNLLDAKQAKIDELQKRIDVVSESIDSFFDNQVGTPTQREYCNFIAEIKQALRGEHENN